MPKINYTPTAIHLDSTQSFDVHVDQDYPLLLHTLLDYILTRKEWGAITVEGDSGTGKLDYYEDGLFLHSKKHPDGRPIHVKLSRVAIAYKALQVSSIKARGGWSNMDYVIQVI